MILHPLAAVESGGAGGLDDGLKVPVAGATEPLRGVAAGPVFVARRIRPAEVFKGGDPFPHGGVYEVNVQTFPSALMVVSCKGGTDEDFCHKTRPIKMPATVPKPSPCAVPRYLIAAKTARWKTRMASKRTGFS